MKELFDLVVSLGGFVVAMFVGIIVLGTPCMIAIVIVSKIVEWTFRSVGLGVFLT